MHQVAEAYVAGLKAAYLAANAQPVWAHFERIKSGATDQDVAALRRCYPDVPAALVSLLTYVDGTYYREFEGEQITFYFLGSDMAEYPYYLLSSAQMVEEPNAGPHFADYVERTYEEVAVDERITRESAKLDWLHFADCMNNGGTSQLFVDFSPAEQGRYGQVVRFTHDPDELQVIADSFEAYLELLMRNQFDFINEDVLS